MPYSYSLFGKFNHKVRGSELHPKSTKVVTKKQTFQTLRRLWSRSLASLFPASARRLLRNLVDIAAAVLSLRPFKGIQKLKIERHNARVIEASSLFDASWYASTYPDVIAAGYQPSIHSVRYGFAQKRQPGPNFDAVWYCDAYEDVGANSENPLLHYIYFGEAEGRRKRSLPSATISSSIHEEQFAQTNIETLLNSELFDATWYLNQYPDVASSDSDPVKHFLVFGGSERRNPSAHFDTAKYLQLHPDVKQLGLNPLLHYELHGREEGREIAPVTSE